MGCLAKALGTCPPALDFPSSPLILYLPIIPLPLPCLPLLTAGSPSKAQITYDVLPCPQIQAHSQ